MSLFGINCHIDSCMREKISKSATTLNIILDAAITCYLCSGVDITTLDQVAAKAGVGRTTVYRYAKNRRELLSRVLLRDAEEALKELEVATRYFDSLEDVVVESLLFLMRRRHHYPMQKILYGDNQQAASQALSLEALCDLSAVGLQEHYRRAKENNSLPAGLSLPVLLDWVSRITMSLHSQPSEFTESEAALRDYLDVVLRPIFKHP